MQSRDTSSLADLLRWLQEMPTAFSGSQVAVHAVVADLVETLTGEATEMSEVKAFQARGRSKAERNRLAWVLAGCHLLWHPTFRDRGLARKALLRFLEEDLERLASILPAERLQQDEERREELIRRALGILGLRLPGESNADAEDRLSQVDSVQRQLLLREAADKERRAREIRDRMAERAAREAAARYFPE